MEGVSDGPFLKKLKEVMMVGLIFLILGFTLCGIFSPVFFIATAKAYIDNGTGAGCLFGIGTILLLGGWVTCGVLAVSQIIKLM